MSAPKQTLENLPSPLSADKVFGKTVLGSCHVPWFKRNNYSLRKVYQLCKMLHKHDVSPLYGEMVFHDYAKQMSEAGNYLH